MTASVLWSGGTGYSVSSPVAAPIQQAVLTIPPTAPQFPGDALSIYVSLKSTGSFEQYGLGVTPRWSFSFLPNVGALVPPDGYNPFVTTDPSIASGGTLLMTSNLGALGGLGLSDSGVISVMVCDCQVHDLGYKPWFVSIAALFLGPPTTYAIHNVNGELGPFLAIDQIYMQGTYAPTFSLPSYPAIPVAQQTDTANGVTTALAAFVPPFIDTDPLAYPLVPHVGLRIDTRWDWAGPSIDSGADTNYVWAGPRLKPIPVAPLGARSFGQVVG